MVEHEERRAVAFLVGFTLGLAVGAGAALLLAPQSGRVTRRRLRRAAEELGATAAERWREFRGEAADAARRTTERAKERWEEICER